MFVDILLVIVGVSILLAGGEALVRGASSLARGLGVSELAIGLTVVAFGTSAPELAVNISAAVGGASELSFGNIFGSNLANIGLIVGLSAVLSPLPIQSVVLRRELPMLLLATAAAAVMASDFALDHTGNVYSRSDALIFLLLFIVFLYYTVGDLMRQREARERAEEVAQIHDQEIPKLFRDSCLIVAGLAGLLYGADLTVVNAVDVANALGVPQVIIGLTLVSIGTSMPELAAALVAVYRKQTDMAVGGVVGSNIFNTLLVAGVTAGIAPIEIPPGGHVDLLACGILSLVLMFASSTHRGIIIRYEGGALVFFYIAYLVWRMPA